jgi:20S proteasome alpha/beta subunit
MGSGGYAAMSVLENKYRPKLKEKEAIDLGKYYIL